MLQRAVRRRVDNDGTDDCQGQHDVWILPVIVVKLRMEVDAIELRIVNDVTLDRRL